LVHTAMYLYHYCYRCSWSRYYFAFVPPQPC
jgi:hypothetical protein